MTKYGDKADLSRMDWMIATDMAKSGNWTQQDVEEDVIFNAMNERLDASTCFEQLTRFSVPLHLRPQYSQ